MGPQILVEVLVPLSFFALIFGIFYIRNRENMALIERGINPRLTQTRQTHFASLKLGLLIAGAGIGLLLAYFIDYNMAIAAAGKDLPGDRHTIYFAMLGICGGIGLVLSYFIEKKHWDSKQ
jgi:Na+/H+ antiporter NhaA